MKVAIVALLWSISVCFLAGLIGYGIAITKSIDKGYLKNGTKIYTVTYSHDIKDSKKERSK